MIHQRPKNLFNQRYHAIEAIKLLLFTESHYKYLLALVF